MLNVSHKLFFVNFQSIIVSKWNQVNRSNICVLCYYDVLFRKLFMQDECDFEIEFTNLLILRKVLDFSETEVLLKNNEALYYLIKLLQSSVILKTLSLKWKFSIFKINYLKHAIGYNWIKRTAFYTNIRSHNMFLIIYLLSISVIYLSRHSDHIFNRV